ncbi:MAG TPA: matrixin family metalloprotease [Candidatus Obscuribacterales bacterium]
MQNPVRVGVPAGLKRGWSKLLLALLLTMVQGSYALVYAAPDPGNHLESAKSSAQRIRRSQDTFVADDFCLEIWRPERMPLKVYLAPGDGVEAYDPRFAESFKDACAQLSASMSQEITFVFVDNADASDIDVCWTSEKSKWPPNKWPDAIGLCHRTANSDGEMEHASIFLLTKFPNFQRLGTNFMEEVCLHELGHACGLGHSLRRADIMNKLGYSQSPGSFDADGRYELSEPPKFSDRDTASLKVLISSQHRIMKIRHDYDRVQACNLLNDEAFKLITQGDNGQSLIYLRAAVELDGTNKLGMQNAMVALFNCAVILNNKEQYAEALPLLKKALNLGHKVGTKQEVSGILHVQQNCSMRVDDATKKQVMAE